MDTALSIVIPAHNESKCISNLLISIKECFKDASLNYETIIVNNGSTDDTRDVTRQYECTVFDINKNNAAGARNYGVYHSLGKVIAFLDADVRITQSWADELIRKINVIECNDIVTGARCSVREAPGWLEKNWFEPLSAKEVDYINGANIVLSRTVFEKVGGFDQSLDTGEDYEFSMRAKKKGVNVIENKKLKVIHDGFPTTIKEFFKREVWHGKGDFGSIQAFKESKVANMALLFTLMHLSLFVSILFLSKFYVVVFALAIVALVIMMSVKIFHNYGISFIIKNIPLCYIYLSGRSFSLGSLLLKK